ncbi:HK97-gp10 family putative phage morphogenesis protein [Deinococcus navajonensis]|uniref:HK97-gp10 family putative phage morphogenesis protein n=1 Tax=Deinococcus navajonensis TaxID=309884 RepID=A0ABV8XN21_9DEIO
MSFKATNGRAAATLIAHRRAALMAQEIRTEAVLAAPVDTGRLRQSIGVQKVSDGHYRVGTNVVYAPFVEFGTRHNRAQPFLRPAFEKVRRG